MSESTQKIVDAVRANLSSARRRLLLARVARGIVIGLVSAVMIWLILAGAEMVFWMSSSVRIVALVAAALVVAALLGRFVLDPLARWIGVLRAPEEDAVAHLVEQRIPSARDRIVNVLHLSSGRHTTSTQDLVEEAIQMLAAPIAGSRFEKVEDFSGVRRAIRMAVLPLAALAVVVLAAPSSFLGATSRLTSPATDFARPAPYSIDVRPGNSEIIRGDSLLIEIDIHGATDVRPHLEIQRSGERSVTTVRPEPAGSAAFQHREANIRQSFDYRVNTDPVVTDWFTVTVVDRPAVRELNVTIDSPAYSRIGRVELGANVGDVTALPGSRVSLQIETGGSPTTTASLVFDNGLRVPLAVEAGAVSGNFRLTRNGSYHIELTSSGGIENVDPITYRLALLSDESPAVVITRPDVTAELTSPFEPTVAARIIDDYGFRRVSLMFRLAQSRFGAVSEAFSELPIEGFQRFELDQVIERSWRMRSESGLSPVPGDVIEYFIRVWDNDSYSGFKSADSRLHQFVLPSLADQYRETEDRAEEAEDDLEELLDKTAHIEERFDELRDELRRNPEVGWDDERQLEQIEEMQREVEKGLDDVADAVEDLAQQLQDKSLISEETMSAYEELQRAIEEINSPELMEALQKLREAMQSMDLQQMQQSMQDFEFNEEQFKERLERALDLFKRLQASQALEEAARRAEELAKLQEEIRNETEELAGRQDERQDPSDSDTGDPEGDPDSGSEEAEKLARQQEDAEAEMKELQERLQDVQEMMEEIPRVPTEQLEQIRSELEQQDVPAQMRENAEQLRQQQMQPAMQGQQQMQQQLQSLQQQLAEMQKSMEGRQLDLNMAGLRQALNDVLILSKQQEVVLSGVDGSAPESPALRRFAKTQIELGEGLQVVSDTLRQLSREVPEMSREVQVQTGSALREMTQATDALADRSARRASAHQKASMMHLNELALLLSDLLSMLMNQQMNMGMPSMQQMLQQLQQMAGQQQQLNQQIQEMLNNMQGQRLTQDMQARMRQLAQQQEQIKQQLKEMNRNPELRGKALGDLNRIAEQMEESIRELQQFRANRELQQRQQQILTRLLDASRSLNTRGRERRRESRTGDDLDRESPAEFTPDDRADQLRRDLIRALETGYAPDYEELIKRYFELLQESTEPASSE